MMGGAGPGLAQQGGGGVRRMICLRASALLRLMLSYLYVCACLSVYQYSRVCVCLHVCVCLSVCLCLPIYQCIYACLLMHLCNSSLRARLFLLLFPIIVSLYLTSNMLFPSAGIISTQLLVFLTVCVSVVLSVCVPGFLSVCVSV